ncbi:MAG: aminoacetone oxidase family FAD-binding enzyme [Verrucomicrobiales bacterium]|nr:aminoacetone oxidase family FAD-binding enzyme [Verrucomicrobiales bacterium]
MINNSLNAPASPQRMRVVVVGGGAAGFFAAITCAEANPDVHVVVLERTAHFLSKVRISGGGRCNVTNRMSEPKELSQNYPRGRSALVGPFHTFTSRDTVEWFESRGVELKVEGDGRVFPTTDSSQTIIDCLTEAARRAGVELRADSSVQTVKRLDLGFELELSNGEILHCDKLMLATGGCRTPAAGQLAVALGHSLEPPVPSLFTFHVGVPWLRELAGISVPTVQVSVPTAKLKEQGPLLITHSGVSGPAILRISAWGARALHAMEYKFSMQVNWLPQLNVESLSQHLDSQRKSSPSRLVVNSPIAPLAGRLWEALVLSTDIPRETRWADLSSASRHRLIQQLTRMELPVSGKTLNADEFVTCGGVPLSEVNFKTMESKVCPGLHFGGELLDIDGITGGFNFQSAWTTGWLAGNAMAKHA